jgi:dTDP-4-dehydrorhamnose reductase
MPKVILTGMGGTVAPVVAAELRRRGYTTVRWHKEEVSPTDEAACVRFIESESPDWIAHIATGPEEWCTTIARECARRGTGLIHTGSVSVYSGKQVGPFAVTDDPDPDDDYGRYKLRCEGLIFNACPEAIIARIGWQIGDALPAPGGTYKNHMVHFFARKAAEQEGRVEASDQWTPGSSFLDDTAAALADLMERREPGLYHVDGNPGLTFFEITRRLARLHDTGWNVVPSHDRAGSSRMVDPRVLVRSIEDRLSE